MSAEIVNTNTTATKVKKITLAGKYTKFMVFGHWFIQRLNADEAVAAAARDTLLMFASPEEQNQMFDLFFNELKTSTTEMKSLIKQHNKPPAKAKKEKKDPSEKTTKPKAKGKKATEVVTDPQDALVAEIKEMIANGAFATAIPITEEEEEELNLLYAKQRGLQ